MWIFTWSRIRSQRRITIQEWPKLFALADRTAWTTINDPVARRNIQLVKNRKLLAVNWTQQAHRAGYFVHG